MQPIRSSFSKAYLKRQMQKRTSGVEMDALEAENNETAASSQTPVTASQITIRRGSERRMESDKSVTERSRCRNVFQYVL